MTDKIPESLTDMDAYTLADGARRAGVGAVLSNLRPQTSASQFVGRALTARIHHEPNGSIPLEEYGTGNLIAAAGQDDVIILDAGGVMLTVMGDLAIHALKRAGAAAAVLNACARDIEEIESIGFPVFAIGSAITTIAGRAKITDIGKPVTIDGISVATGDLIAGCRGGIVVVPWQDHEKALFEAARVLESDQKVLEGIKNGESFNSLWSKHKALGKSN